MFTNPEQFANATKTLFDLQMQTFNALATKTVKGVEQVVALNMATAKTSMEGTLAAGKDMSEARNPREALAAMQSRMNATGATAYGQQLKTIIDGMQTEFRDAADTHMAEAKNTLSALIYDVTQNVKPGSENAVEVIKAAIDNAFQGYEQVTQATRQAVKQVEERIAKASEMVTPGMAKQQAAGQETSAE
jgi:phasin family protein